MESFALEESRKLGRGKVIRPERPDIEAANVPLGRNPYACIPITRRPPADMLSLQIGIQRLGGIRLPAIILIHLFFQAAVLFDLLNHADPSSQPLTVGIIPEIAGPEKSTNERGS